jgi:hypothetical protein
MTSSSDNTAAVIKSVPKASVSPAYKSLNEITLITATEKKNEHMSREGFLYTYSLSFLAASCSEFGMFDRMLVSSS